MQVVLHHCPIAEVAADTLLLQVDAVTGVPGGSGVDALRAALRAAEPDASWQAEFGAFLRKTAQIAKEGPLRREAGVLFAAE